jgi:long-chain acyl-CoA synthetase
MTSSHEAQGLPPSLGGGNLALSLATAAKVRPERAAITHGGATVTVGELWERSARAAAMLASRGVGRGDRVAIQLPNVPAFADFYFGVLRLGAVVVPVNPLLRAAESAYTLEDAGPRVLIAWHESELPDAGPDPVEVIPIVEPFGGGVLDPYAAGAAADGAAGDAGGDGAVEVDPEETAVILYTSGTTGRPKGAELTHRNLGLNTRAVVHHLGMEADDVLLGTLPLFHSFGQTCTLNASLAVGARLALLTRFDAAAAVELIDRERVTILMGVPTMLAGIAAAATDHGPFPGLRIAASGGAPLPREQAESFERVTGVPVLDTWGLSETSPAATLNRPGSMRVGSVGRPIDGVEVQAVGDDNEGLPAGETGQLAIRGHNVMKGYWRRPEATAAAITPDGWFLTGDLGRVDEDGFVFVVGRLKDMIIRGGMNIYPREVEEVLHRHPAVSEAAVVGVPDERLGEDVGAAVVLAPGASAEPEELRDWLKQRVAPFKYPRQVWLLDDLPKGPTGKILKREIHPPAAGAAGAPSEEAAA